METNLVVTEWGRTGYKHIREEAKQTSAAFRELIDYYSGRLFTKISEGDSESWVSDRVVRIKGKQKCAENKTENYTEVCGCNTRRREKARAPCKRRRRGSGDVSEVSSAPHPAGCLDRAVWGLRPPAPGLPHLSVKGSTEQNNTRSKQTKTKGTQVCHQSTRHLLSPSHAYSPTHADTHMLTQKRTILELFN